MAVPIKYNVRNLLRRKTRTALTVAGIAVAVFVVVLTLSLVRGMWGSVGNTASPGNLLLLSRKGQTVMQSQIENTDAVLLETVPGLKRTPEGIGYVSPELLYMVGLTFDEHPDAGRFHMTLRGVDPEVAFLVHDKVQVNERDQRARGVTGPQPDGGILVGPNAHIRMGVPAAWLDVGKVLWFGKKPSDPSRAEGKFVVLGRLDAPSTIYQSEIWAELEFLKALVEVQQISLVSLKIADPARVQAALESIRARQDVELDAQTEAEYYADYYDNLNAATLMIILIALVVCGGGVLVGMNTMYAAVMGRVREIGTLKVLGFRRRQVLLSFVVESVIIAAAAGGLGTAAAWALPLVFTDFQGLQIFQTAFTLRVTPETAAAGMAAAILLGVLGALPPAIKGVRMPVVDAMRAV